MKVGKNMINFFKGINKTAVIVATILGLSIVVYGYMNVSHKSRVFEVEQEKRQKRELELQAQKMLFNACVQSAEDYYYQTWDDVCNQYGLEKRCGLHHEIAENIRRVRTENIEECRRKYPFK